MISELIFLHSFCIESISITLQSLRDNISFLYDYVI